ncbi:MAG: hypothetical protein JXR97_03145 [Planctomycetes bacterium]|nr:hypothetical protein [Planctomycetota bacterium]
MSFWERHRDICVVIGAFLGLLFILWLFLMRGNASETASALADFKNNEKRRESFCPEQGTKVQVLEKVLETSNEKLSERLKELKAKLNYDFSKALIPPDHMPNRQVYVRNQYDLLKQYFLQEMESKRDIKLDDKTLGLGMVIPEETTEPLSRDELWMKQFVTLRRVMDLLLSIHEEQDGTRNILSITSIKPLAPMQGEEVQEFIREFPVEVELNIRMTGILSLLDKCSKSGDYFVLQALEIDSSPKGRQARKLNNKQYAEKNKLKEFESWYGHYHKVKLVLAAEMLTDPAKSEDKTKNKNNGNSVIKVIPH